MVSVSSRAPLRGSSDWQPEEQRHHPPQHHPQPHPFNNNEIAPTTSKNATKHETVVATRGSTGSAVQRLRRRQPSPSHTNNKNHSTTAAPPPPPPAQKNPQHATTSNKVGASPAPHRRHSHQHHDDHHHQYHQQQSQSEKKEDSDHHREHEEDHDPRNARDATWTTSSGREEEEECNRFYSARAAAAAAAAAALLPYPPPPLSPPPLSSSFRSRRPKSHGGSLVAFPSSSIPHPQKRVRIQTDTTTNNNDNSLASNLHTSSLFSSTSSPQHPQRAPTLLPGRRRRQQQQHSNPPSPNPHHPRTDPKHETLSSVRPTPPTAAGKSPCPTAQENYPHVVAIRRCIADLRSSLYSNGASSLDHCRAALTGACEIFNHSNEYRHDLELLHGASDVVLEWLLSAASAAANNNDDQQTEIVVLLLTAFEMLCRASPSSIYAATRKWFVPPPQPRVSTATTPTFTPPHDREGDGWMGDNGRRDSNNTTAELLLLPTLLDLLDRFERLQPYLPHSNVCVLNIARILYSCSRAPELRSVLGRSFALRAVLARTPVQTSTSPLVLPVNQTATSVVDNSPECRLWKLHTLAYLVTNNVENRVLFYEQDGLLDTVLRVGHFDPAIATRQHAAAVLLAFSSSSPHGTSSTTPTAATCSTIPVSMSHNNKVLGTLVKMVLLEKDSTVIRETAVSTLQNLAFWHENRHALVVFRNGMVLEAMKHSLLSDPCEKVRRRVAGALANLVCEETVARIAHYKGLLEALAMVATNDINSAVQERASLALTKIASSMSVKMECHTAVMDALVVASLSSAKNGVSALLRVKARLSKNRQVMARHAGVMDTLTDFCMSESVPSSDRDNAIRTLMHLANDDSNRSILCHNANVLAAMVAVAGRENSSHQQEIPEADAATNDRFDSDDEARDSAIRALERLATYNSNRVIMARHPGLIVAVAKAVEREAQWEQESRRARSEDNGVREADTRGKGEYLAKPLLLSLLVAM